MNMKLIAKKENRRIIANEGDVTMIVGIINGQLNDTYTYRLGELEDEPGKWFVDFDCEEGDWAGIVTKLNEHGQLLMKRVTGVDFERSAA